MSADDDWSRVFLETQKKYWDSWVDWTGHAASAAKPAPPTGFPPGVDAWFKKVNQNLSGDGAEFYRKTFDAGRSYFDMGQVFFNMAKEMQAAGDSWKAVLDENMKALKKSLGQECSTATDAWSAYAGNWGLNGGAWGDFMKSMGQQPVDASNMMGVNAAEAWERLFKVPAMGYHREMQEEVQRWGLLAGENAKAMQAYAGLLNETNADAVDRMSCRMAELIPAGEAPTTLRGMYDLWVDCGEEAYNELTSNERFLKAQGALMNSAMRLKKQENEMTQEMLGMLNIPNRKEMDTALCRLHDVRAELRDLEDRIESAEVESLRKQLSELRDQVRVLTEHQAAWVEANQEPAAAKPATARKTTTTRRKPAARKTTTTARNAKTTGPKATKERED